MLTSVLNERLKVDNGFQISRGNGTAVLDAPVKIAELHSVEWQPHPKGTAARPSLGTLKALGAGETKAEEGGAPKKLFKFGKGSGGQNSAFQQMMRQQMGNGNDKTAKGPRRADPQKYAELAEKQAAMAADAIASQASTLSAGLGQQAAFAGNGGQARLAAQLEKLGLQGNVVEEKAEERAPVANWRRGNFTPAEEQPGAGSEPKGGLGNLGNVVIHDGGGKKKGKKGKRQMVVVSGGEPKEQMQQQQMPQMPATEGDFPTLDDA